MSYTDSLQDTLQALQFEEDGVRALQNNGDAVTYGIITAIIAGLATAIGTLNPLGIITNPISYLIGLAIGSGITHLFAKLFGGQGSYRDIFAVMSNATLAYWVAVIPILGWFLSILVGLYMIAFSVYAIMTVYDLSVVKSILVLILPGILVAIVIGALLFLFVGSLVGSLGLGLLSAA